MSKLPWIVARQANSSRNLPTALAEHYLPSERSTDLSIKSLDQMNIHLLPGSVLLYMLRCSIARFATLPAWMFRITMVILTLDPGWDLYGSANRLKLHSEWHPRFEESTGTVSVESWYVRISDPHTISKWI